jgi:cellulose biosynthesis protein BcsQ
MPRPPRMRVLSISNQSGRVGKTTTVVNVAVALALHGSTVLVIDMDPQGQASTGLNIPHHPAIPDVYDCLVAGALRVQVCARLRWRQRVQRTVLADLPLLPTKLVHEAREVRAV